MNGIASTKNLCNTNSPLRIVKRPHDKHNCYKLYFRPIIDIVKMTVPIYSQLNFTQNDISSIKYLCEVRLIQITPSLIFEKFLRNDNGKTTPLYFK